MGTAARDVNRVPTLIGVSNADGTTPITVYVDPVTHRILVNTAGGAGTVTTVSVVTANGVSGSVANPTTTPAITFTLGAITPTSVNASGLINSGGGTGSSQLNGTNMGFSARTTFTSPADGQLNILTSSLATGVGLDVSTDAILKIRTRAQTGDAAITVSSLSTSATSPLLLTNGQLVTVTLTSQTVGGATLTIPDFANVSDEFTFKTKAQTMSNKTFIAPALGAATATSINGLVITSTTGTFTLTNAKTLTVSDSTTLATNSMTLAGGEVITFSATNALSLLTTGTTAMTFPAATDTVVTLAATQTLTNKRITVRVGTETSSATSTPTADTVDQWNVTALAAADAFAAPTGTPTDGQTLIIRIKDNGTARALTWNAIYRASSDLALPSTTIISKTLYLGFRYNNADSKWDLLALLNNF